MIITKLKYRYVKKYDLYDVDMEVDNYTRHVMYLHRHRLATLDRSFPDVLASMLKAKIDCKPKNTTRSEDVLDVDRA